jgi:L-amino acid N-acyltransferase YncA
VADQDGTVVAYAYAGRHNNRGAYDWSVDVSAYVHPDQHRRGLGRALYTALFGILQAQGFHRAFAGITLPNPASVGMHQAMGFSPVGVYHETGWKHGAWRDVGWWERPLGNSGPPRPLHTVDDLDDRHVAASLTAGEQLIRP